MNSLHDLIHDNGSPGWIDFWTVIGWLGNAVFFSRFFVQWYATEKKRQVVVPAVFWILSLFGSLLMLAYAIFYDKHHVIIFAYAFTWIPYLRNLIIHYRHEKAHLACANCGTRVPPQTNFCPHCGTKLLAATSSP